MPSLVIYQPDIAQNLGTMLRLCACMGIDAHIIEPCGFPLSDAALRRAGMDYIDHVHITRHISWSHFQDWRKKNHPETRLVLLSTKASAPYTDFQYQPDDFLMVGRESAGVPDDVHNASDARVLIPMQGGMRSLNVAISAAMVVGEALRQTNLSG